MPFHQFAKGSGQLLSPVLDPGGNLVNSGWTNATVTDTSALNPYSQHVLADGATKYWRLND